MCRSDDSILGKRDRVAAGARQPLLGAALLEPAAAQRTAMIRTAGFASAAEIGLLLSTAEELRAANAGGKEPDSESTMDLQRGSLPVALKPLVERICAHVARVDADNWGVLAALQLPLPGDGVHGVNVRVAPFPRRKLRRRRSSLSAPRVRQVRSVELHNHRCMGSSGEERGGSRRVLPQADGSDAVSEVEVAEHSQACLRWQRECYLGCWRGRAVSFHQQCLCQG